ncbi:MAG: hypothetical protein ACP5O7_11875 [Phycisphaerae bacterium]
MSKAFSMTAGVALIGCATLSHTLAPSTTVSAEAKAVRSAEALIFSELGCSQALSGPKALAESEVRSLASQCAHDGWDGNGASALDPSAVDRAVELIWALPRWVPMPEAAAEPDGAVSLDWVHSRFRLLSLSVGGSGRIAYAWLDGTDTGYGVRAFDGCTVHNDIISLIRMVVGNGGTFIRAA